jgi:hypothetical protein
MLCHSLRRYLLGGNPFDYRLPRVTQSPTPGEDTHDNTHNSEDTHDDTYNDTYNGEDTHDGDDTHNGEITHNGEDTHEDTHNGEYTHDSENTRSDPTRKRKRASSVQEQKQTSPRTSSPPRPLYNTDSYNAELEPRCFRYKRDINHLRTLAKIITRGNDKAIVVAVVRTEADRKRPLTTFPEHVITATPSAKRPPSLRVQQFDIEGNSLKGKWSSSRGGSFAHGNVAIYGYWLEPFDTVRGDELNAFISRPQEAGPGNEHGIGGRRA